MVGYSEDLDAGGAQFRHRGLEFGDRIDAQREMIHPRRRIRRGFGGLPIAKVEKRDARSIRHTKEDMRMRGVFLRARHAVLRYDMHQRQPKDVFVKVSRLLRVAASIGEMMQAMDGNEGRHTAPPVRRSVTVNDDLSRRPLTLKLASKQRTIARRRRDNGAARKGEKGGATTERRGKVKK